MYQPWPVLNFGTCVVKPLGITVKKAVEKCINRKIKKYVLYINATDMARFELWTQCCKALRHCREEGSRIMYKQKNKKI
jgi:hypothetical protein